MAEPENVIQMWHHKSSDLLIFVCPINTFPVKCWSGSIIHEMKLRNGCLSIIKSTVKWQYWKYWNMYVELRHYNLTVAVVFEPKWLPFSGFLLFTFCHTNIFKRRTEPLHQSMREIMRKPLVLRARGAQLNVFFFADVIIIAKPVIDHADGSVENTSTTDCIQRNWFPQLQEGFNPVLYEIWHSIFSSQQPLNIPRMTKI